MYTRRPRKQGLYDPAYEHDSCGIGFVANVDGSRSHAILQHAREMLVNMSHRGATGSEKASGDGAGVLTALPEKLLRERLSELGHELPEEGRFAAGIAFLPAGEKERSACLQRLEAIAEEEGQRLLAALDVPRTNSMLGRTSAACEPEMRMLVVAAGDAADRQQFERKLYAIRKRAGSELRGGQHDADDYFYICSLSSRVVVYKGMLTPGQLFEYYGDLRDPRYESHLAMIHSRFSTNTFPSWDRAQPMRYMSHNGEINTLRGNVNKMAAREGQLDSNLFGEDIAKLLPVVEPDSSDSGAFDNVLELLLLSGRPLPEVAMMMVPEAWQNREDMDPRLRAAYEYMSCSMEPWDGPASISFTDGNLIGALLDRNGLRPSRYYLTKDGLVIMASEVGVLPQVRPEDVVQKGRIRPGDMFLVDFERGQIVDARELKQSIAAARPYEEWLRSQRVTLQDLAAAQPSNGAAPETAAEPGGEALHARLRMFGYTLEHLNLLLRPMVLNGTEPLGSMGNDTPLAVLSERPRLLYDYFKQLFAQVTNPPIDSIREKSVMSLKAYIGPERNLLDATPEHCRRLLLEHPVLMPDEFAAISRMDHRGMRAVTIDCTYALSEGEAGLERALDRICDEAQRAIEDGCAVAVLSDRAAGRDRMPVDALLAVGAVHHHLVRGAQRQRIALVLDSGEPREVHHYCALIGYGADAVHPYMALEAIAMLFAEGRLEGRETLEECRQRYRNAISYGMRKVFGKMGISTLESYKGAQIFEIVGLAESVVERAFAGTASRIGGIAMPVVAREALRRHAAAYPPRTGADTDVAAGLANPGEYQWRKGGERHMWDPQSIADLQETARANDPAAFERMTARQDGRSRRQSTVRGLLRFRAAEPVPLEEVEPASEIMRRFATGAMSFGSISQEAHETLAIAMNRIGGRSNTGEGGEMPERYQPLPNGDSKRSSIKQIASGRFGANIEYLTNADEIQIKMAQGAKPGEGGELPGHKVFEVIARTRHSTPGVGLISPPPHHDIYSIEDLAQLIFDLKNANPRARISVKLVAEVGVGTVAAGVAKAHADHILISGHDGGTGASPLTGIKHAGLPWELGLAETHQTLVLNGLRTRVVLQTDGQIKTARDVVIAALLGAEECGFSTSALIAMGCIMMRACHKNTCPVGIATQDERLRKKFIGTPENVVNYFTHLAEGVRRQMAALGLRTFNEMVGRADLLEPDTEVLADKAQDLDLSALLHRPRPGSEDDSREYCCISQDHGIEDVMDRRLITVAEGAAASSAGPVLEAGVTNRDRTLGAMLSNHITRERGAEGAAASPLWFKLRGSAGQSFGAWTAKGITFELEGDANDYVGKGLSGGTLIIYPPAESVFVPEENMLIGNVAFYGAVEGRAYLNGMAAERFCVRNSGAHVVVEGVGDHACEYMTGGRAVILGPTGRNFGAGMSGGIAYVWDPRQRLEANMSRDMVRLEPLGSDDADTVRRMVTEHRDLTGSAVAERMLLEWEARIAQFVRVISPEYKRVLEGGGRAVGQAG